MDESAKIADVAKLVQAVTLVATTADDDPTKEQCWGYMAQSLGRVLELVLFRRPTDDELASAAGV